VYEVSEPKGRTSIDIPNSLPLQRLKNQEQCNQLVLDLAKDMACTLGYIEDVKQFARLAQLKQAIRDVTPLMDDTTNFVVEFAYDGRGS